jgi:TatD DNase family protein
MIDTHCHLDIIEEQGLDIQSSLAKSLEAGVTNIVQIGINYENSLNAKKIAHESKTEIQLNYTIGCHPADDIQEKEINQIKELIETSYPDNKFLGIGEIGLDYYHNKENIEFQKKTFREFVELSIHKNLPIVIHSRDAAEDTFKILSEYKNKAFGVLHCFTYDAEYAKKFSDLGYYISFSGVVVFKNAKDVQEAAREIKLKNILIETDAPFLSPPPFRGQRNDSSNLKYILEKIFSLRTEANSEVQEIIYNNSINFISKKRVE